MPRGRLRIPRAAIAQRGFAQYAHEMRVRADDVSPAWDAVMGILFDAEQALFENEGHTEEHPRWESLSDNPSRWLGGLSYKEWKEDNFPGNPILTLTSRMRDQLTGLSGDHYEVRTNTYLTFGSNLPVDSGEGHDLGGIHAVGRRWPPMPAREPFRITQQNADDIADVLVDYVTGTSRD